MLINNELEMIIIFFHIERNISSRVRMSLLKGPYSSDFPSEESKFIPKACERVPKQASKIRLTAKHPLKIFLSPPPGLIRVLRKVY